LFVRLAGCTIGCRFCDTPDSLRPGAAYRVLRPGPGGELVATSASNPIGAASLDDLIAEFVREHGPFQALAVTGGEPLEQVEFLEDWLPGVELPVLLETAGTLPEALARVIDQVEIVSMDIKLPSVARVPDQFEAHRRFLRIAARKDAYVKVVVNRRVDRAEWDLATALVAEVAPGTPFFIQPETDRSGGPRVGFALLSELAARAARAGLEDVRILPQIHPFLGAP
jgi:organic radical activating enzyme